MARGASSRGPQCDWLHDVLIIYSGRVDWLGYTVSAKRKETLGSMAFGLWDTGVDSIIYVGNRIEWLASITTITTHLWLRQNLQNARRLIQSSPNQENTLMEWINAAICNVWSNIRGFPDTVSEWHIYAKWWENWIWSSQCLTRVFKAQMTSILLAAFKTPFWTMPCLPLLNPWLFLHPMWDTPSRTWPQ